MASDADRERGFRIRADMDGTVRLSWVPGVHITGVLAVAAMSAVDEFNGDRGRPLLVDMSGVAALAREARTVFTRPCSATRIAILGVSSVDRVIATFGLRLSNPPTPARFFTSEPDALTWLRDGDAGD
jgi:hypothetical protein